MNNVRQIERLNQVELDNVVAPEASWHTDYRDTAYIYIGGLPFDLSEGDIVTIFSQFGEPVFINLARDKETGKSRGFAWLKYEDQRSCDLAVDNLGGATILGRVLRVDHTRYKRKDDEQLGDNTEAAKPSAEKDQDARHKRRKTAESESEEERRPLLREEIELGELMRNHDDDDPMKEYLIKEKREEVAKAVERARKKESKSGRTDRHREREDGSKSRHRHRHHHRSEKERSSKG